MTYECPICQSINHAVKLHCSNCGTTPSQYSIIGRPCNSEHTEVVIAYGAVRAAQHHKDRVRLQTVALEYYGEK